MREYVLQLETLILESIDVWFLKIHQLGQGLILEWMLHACSEKKLFFPNL